MRKKACLILISLLPMKKHMNWQIIYLPALKTVSAKLEGMEQPEIYRIPTIGPVVLCCVKGDIYPVPKVTTEISRNLVQNNNIHRLPFIGAFPAVADGITFGSVCLQPKGDFNRCIHITTFHSTTHFF